MPQSGRLKQTAIIQAKRRHWEEQEHKLSHLAKYGRSLVTFTRYCLKIKQREELRQLRGEARRRREKRPRFATWLHSYGIALQAE
ncbi:hypothetical protein AGMMS49925_01520 [Deltaproteobacteria bacterium]|nr:hypothetical protein AGMMS49925_01520 [Deltaproteobacteria bacterium]